MPGDGSRALARLGHLIRCVDAAPSPFAEADLTRAVNLAARLCKDLFAREAGIICAAGRPDPADAAAAFAPCPDPGRDRAGYQAWHAVQGGLFLHYAPIAGHLLGRDSVPDERARTLLIGDALRLLGDHAAGLGRDARRYDAVARPAAPFSSLIQRTDRPCSGRSSDVNLGAVTLALAVESGMRHALDLPAGAHLSMWRVFRALAEAEGEVRLTVELPTLVAVYNWAGRHRRAGRRGYGWLNFLAADLLHPLFVPPAPLGFGLAAAPEALARLRDAATAADACSVHRAEGVTCRPRSFPVAVTAAA